MSPTDQTRSVLESRDRKFTAEEYAEWRRKVAEEEAALPANLSRLRRMDDAAAEQTFSGQLRRAIRDAHIPHHTLAAHIGVTWRQLLDFEAGDAALPSDAIDRLIVTLALIPKLESATASR
ncbi:MAG: hypothetical protein AB7I48_09370 [Planctomycetaceae bacterium]